MDFRKGNRRRSLSALTRKSNPFNLPAEDTIKRSVSLPARPSGNGWATRLWDNMYGSQEEAPKQNNLQDSVKQLFKEGQSLRSILKTVEFVLEESQPSVPVLVQETKQNSEDSVIETKSIKEAKEESEEVFYSANDLNTEIRIETEASKTKNNRVSQRVVSYLLNAVAGRKAEIQNKKRTKKIKSFRKPQIQPQQKGRPGWMSQGLF